MASHKVGHYVIVWHYRPMSYGLPSNARDPLTFGGREADAPRVTEMGRVYMVFDEGNLSFFITEAGLHLPQRSAASVLLDGRLFERAAQAPDPLFDAAHRVRIDGSDPEKDAAEDAKKGIFSSLGGN